TISAQPEANNNQSTNQIIGARSQNNNDQLQTLDDYNGSSQTVGGLFQGAPNTGMQLPRSQNSTNLLANAFVYFQQYTDLIRGMDLFPGSQGIGNSPPQDDQFSTLLDSFP
ncbi:18897_t:CDS:1, partial [Dentiscutata erythropus]